MKRVEVTTIAPGRGGVPGAIAECWRSREILYFLAWRDIKVRYKQTVLGIAWAVLQPLVYTFVFGLVFKGTKAFQPPDGIPHEIFTFAGLLPLILFQNALTRSSESLVTERNVITKVYFPRLLVPASATISALVDFTISLMMLFALMAYFRVPVSLTIVWIPLFVAVTVLAALSAGLWFSALNARYRDVRYMVPFIAAIWLFISPVIYPTSYIVNRVPESWRWIYSLNPMVGVIDGFRWSLYGDNAVDVNSLTISMASVLVVFVGGVFFFRRTERTLVDML